MNTRHCLSLLLFLSVQCFAQEGTDSALAGSEEYLLEDEGVLSYEDSIEYALQFEQGEIEIADGVARLSIPDSFKFLGAEQSRLVLVELWDNPPSAADGVLGMIFPADAEVYDDDFTFVVSYEETGHVSDAEADTVDYDAMLQRMKIEDQVASQARRQQGFDGLELVGWAAPPYYDKERKVLHWAKEMHGDSAETNSLNYNVRVLGRRGVLVLNAIGGMHLLDEVQANIPAVLDIARFNDGHRYDQFDPKTDQLSEMGLAGLIDGQFKAKFTGMLKKMLMIGGISVVALIAIVVVVVIIIRRKSGS